MTENSSSILSGRLESIQALRALAALFVVFHHVPFIGRGAFGVDLFFVISGFIIAHVTRHGQRHFLRKRISRIVPLYWLLTLGLFLLAMIQPALLQASTADPVQLLKSLFFIPFEKSNGLVQPLLFLGWSLNYEMFFYLVFFLFSQLFGAWRIPAISALFVALVVLGEWLEPQSVLLAFYTSPLLLEFLFGLWIWRFREHILAWVRALSVPLVLGAILGLFVLFFQASGILGLARIASIGVLSGLLFCLVLGLEGRCRMPKSLVSLGDASYSLYLLHPYILFGGARLGLSLQNPDVQGLVSLVILLCICAAVSLLSYRWIEYPSNRFLLKRLS